MSFMSCEQLYILLYTIHQMEWRGLMRLHKCRNMIIILLWSISILHFFSYAILQMQQAKELWTFIRHQKQTILFECSPYRHKHILHFKWQRNQSEYIYLAVIWNSQLAIIWKKIGYLMKSMKLVISLHFVDTGEHSFRHIRNKKAFLLTK